MKVEFANLELVGQPWLMRPILLRHLGDSAPGFPVSVPSREVCCRRRPAVLAFDCPIRTFPIAAIQICVQQVLLQEF